MNLGKNLQYLRMLHNNITQEELANKLNVSRQTVSKWELNQVNPELSKIKEICDLFNCTADVLLFGNINIEKNTYSDIQVERLKNFNFIKYIVISNEPEDDALNKIREIAKKNKIENPKIIGWDFSKLSQEQINVYHMHGYTAALVISSSTKLINCEIPVETMIEQDYITITIKNPMENSFDLIGDAYKSLFQYISINKYTYNHFAFEYSYFENEIEYMKIYVAIL